MLKLFLNLERDQLCSWRKNLINLSYTLTHARLFMHNTLLLLLQIKMVFHITRIEGIRYVYNITGLKSWRERPLGRSRDRSENNVTYPGFAWLIRRVLYLMIEFIGPLYNFLQHFTYHYLRLDTLDFWPHFTTPLLRCTPDCSLL
jgi:hypothetical protein